MPRFDLELHERDLARRIAEKERDIGASIEAIRRQARQVSTTTLSVVAGAAILLGAWVTWRAFRVFPRPRHF
jgi:hypothetical protein